MKIPRLFLLLLVTSFILSFSPVSPFSFESVAATATVVKKNSSKKKSSKKKTSKKSSTTPAVSTVQNEPQPAPVSKKKGRRNFEGQLMYMTNEYCDWKTKALSFGQLFNGNRTYYVTVKGDDVDFYDATLHQHTLIKPSEKKIYLYSELTGEGLAEYGELWDNFMVDRERQMVGTVEIVHSSDVHVTDETHEYKGDVCTVFRGTKTSTPVGTTGSSQTKVEMWFIPDLIVGKSLKPVFWGFNPEGVVKKGIVSIQSAAPLLGNFKVQNAFELVGINERPVSDSEVAAPTNIKFKETNDSKDVVAFSKAHNKAMKEMNLKPKTQKVKELKKNISEEWDFANDWDAGTVSLPEGQLTLWQFATDILQATQKDTRIWTEEGESAGNESAKFIAGDTEDSYYIPKLLFKLQSQYREWDNKITDAENKKKHTPPTPMKTVYQRGSFIKVPDTRRPVPARASSPLESLSAAKYVRDNLRNRISFVTKYRDSHKTEFIPKEAYDGYLDKLEDIRKDENARKKAQSKENSKKVGKKVYNDYIKELRSMHYSHYSIDMNLVRRMQNEMRNVRSKHPEISKSPWEDWDGIGDPDKY